MPQTTSIGFMLFGSSEHPRDAFAEEKYAQLAAYFVENGVSVRTIMYNDRVGDRVKREIAGLGGLLVWVNPIEGNQDRTLLDRLLTELAGTGLTVSSHPGTIQKIGTKKVLAETRDMEWGGDTRIYYSYDEFKQGFLPVLEVSKTRILKQFRGDGGNGVYKVFEYDPERKIVKVLHAKRGSFIELMRLDDMFARFEGLFAGGKPLIDQSWNENLRNGIVRCYMSASTVAGFGYQEINALYPDASGPVAPGKRHYYTEHCAFFQDLREAMETKWLPELTRRFGLNNDTLPVIWDADFFINDLLGPAVAKYTLCEINVSCVSPFPESAIPYIFRETMRRLGR